MILNGLEAKCYLFLKTIEYNDLMNKSFRILNTYRVWKTEEEQTKRVLAIVKEWGFGFYGYATIQMTPQFARSLIRKHREVQQLIDDGETPANAGEIFAQRVLGNIKEEAKTLSIASGNDVGPVHMVIVGRRPGKDFTDDVIAGQLCDGQHKIAAGIKNCEDPELDFEFITCTIHFRVVPDQASAGLLMTLLCGTKQHSSADQLHASHVMGSPVTALAIQRFPEQYERDQYKVLANRVMAPYRFNIQKMAALVIFYLTRYAGAGAKWKNVIEREDMLEEFKNVMSFAEELDKIMYENWPKGKNNIAERLIQHTPMIGLVYIYYRHMTEIEETLPVTQIQQNQWLNDSFLKLVDDNTDLILEHCDMRAFRLSTKGSPKESVKQCVLRSKSLVDHFARIFCDKKDQSFRNFKEIVFTPISSQDTNNSNEKRLDTIARRVIASGKNSELFADFVDEESASYSEEMLLEAEDVTIDLNRKDIWGSEDTE